MIFIEQFRARWPWSIGVLESWLSMSSSSSEVPASSILRIPSPDVSSPAVGDIFRSGRCRCVCCRGSQSPRLWETSSGVVAVGVFAAEARSYHSWGCLPQLGTKRRGKGILGMEDAGTSEEDDDIDNQDSNTPIDHGHVARNCSIKIRVTITCNSTV